MAVTPVGNPYVEPSDLVANYPGASEALAERIDIVGVNPFANAAARDAAIPSPVQGQMCSLNDDNKGYRYDGSAWVLFSGAGPANFTNTATGSYTDTGIDYKFVSFLSGTNNLVIDRAGFADLLGVGGGAGGGGSGGGNFGGGGGAGALVYLPRFYLPAGTHTVTIDAGGAAGSNPSGTGATGGTTSIVISGVTYSFGGGGGGVPGSATGVSPPTTAGLTETGGLFSGSAGGGGTGGNAGGGYNPSGNNGAGGAGGGAGGGGGSGGAGTAGGAGAGGLGRTSSITGASVTRSKGGQGGNPVAGTNPGDGGGGGSVTGGGGGSSGFAGQIIVRVSTN